jgi:hypothetical protein
VGLAAGGQLVEIGPDYCWSKAAEYDQRVQEATDECMRDLLCLMRDNWVIAAKDFESEQGGA